MEEGDESAASVHAVLDEGARTSGDWVEEEWMRGERRWRTRERDELMADLGPKLAAVPDGFVDTPFTHSRFCWAQSGPRFQD